MPARFDSHHSGFGSTSAYGVRTVELSQYDWLHIGWRRIVNRCRALQLPPGDYAASLAAPVLTSSVLVGPIAKVEMVEQAGKKHLTDKEDRCCCDNIQGRQRQRAPTGEKRKQRLRSLVEASRFAAGGEVQAALQEAGKQVSCHGHACHQGSDSPIPTDNGTKRGDRWGSVMSVPTTHALRPR